MDIFKNLILYEFKRQVFSYKFILTLSFSLIVTVVCVSVQLIDFDNDLEDYSIELSSNNGNLKSYQVYSEVQIPIIIKPNPLSIFSKGIEKEVGNKAVISIDKLPTFQKTSQKRNPFLAIFNYFDVIDIIIFIVSIFIIFITADVISGEKEDEVLKMIFVNRVSKTSYFSSKYLACLLLIAIPIFFVFFLATIIIYIYPNVSLSFDEFLKILYLFFISLFFSSIFILIGLSISSLSHKKSQALIFGLISWILLLSVYPDTTKFIVQNFMKMPSRYALNREIENIKQEYSNRMNENAYRIYLEINKQKPMNEQAGGGSNIFGFTKILYGSQRYNFNTYKTIVKENIPILFSQQQEIENLYNNMEGIFLKQERINHFLLSLSPKDLIKNASNTVCNTDYAYRILHINKIVKNYRELILDYFEKQGAFGLGYFSPLREEEIRDEFPYPDSMIKELSERRLQLDNLPVIEIKSKKRFPTELINIICLNFILFLIGTYIFKRKNLIK